MNDACEASAYAFSGSSGVMFTASTGDSGYRGGVSYPASSRYVVAVGGTSLYLDAYGNRATESVWTGAGSGCSSYISKPSFQTDASCAKRMVGDVSAVADPATGVYVYSGGFWYQYGGTSLSAPVIAGLAASGYFGTNLGSSPANIFYGSGAAKLYDVASGSNGRCRNYFCKGSTGYDGPSGNGAPKAPFS